MLENGKKDLRHAVNKPVDEMVEIEEVHFDFSVLPQIILVELAKKYDVINRNKENVQIVNENMESIKKLLVDYHENPEMVDDMLITLEIGPALIFAEELDCFLREINKLENEIMHMSKIRIYDKEVIEHVEILKKYVKSFKQYINFRVRKFNSDIYEGSQIDETSIKQDIITK